MPLKVSQEMPANLLDDSNKILALFLRTRRESLDPARLGLPRSGRRRTPGLRREEVAMLANIGVTWYTWLEQGRKVNPSAASMAAIADALQCTPAETRYLFILAGLQPSEMPVASKYEEVSAASRRILDTLMPLPASIVMPNFDIQGYNANYCRLMGVDLDNVPHDDRNSIYQYLTNEHWHNLLGDDDIVLPIFIAYFHAGMTEHRGDPRWENLLERFFEASPVFKHFWEQRHEVRYIENHTMTYYHHELGPFKIQKVNWFSAPRDGSRLLVYVPVDEKGERIIAMLEHKEMN